jgi:hypothetical protein
MSILNYIFFGVLYTFLLDISMDKWSNHPKMAKAMVGWGFRERLFCAAVWPLAVLIFTITVIKTIFRR